MEFSSDGCPNDCGYCKDMKMDCVYEVHNCKCPICGKDIFHKDIYEYRGFESCSDCFDKLKSDVDIKRNDVMNQNNSVEFTNSECPLETEYRKGDKVIRVMR